LREGFLAPFPEGAHNAAVRWFTRGSSSVKKEPIFSIFIVKSPYFPLEPNVGKILHYPNSQKGMYGEERYGPYFA
jgi:hypothetical protein